MPRKAQIPLDLKKYRYVGDTSVFMTAMKHVKLADICIFFILVSPPYEDPQFRVQGQLEKT